EIADARHSGGHHHRIARGVCELIGQPGLESASSVISVAAAPPPDVTNDHAARGIGRRPPSGRSRSLSPASSAPSLATGYAVPRLPVNRAAARGASTISSYPTFPALAIPSLSPTPRP